VQRKPNNKFQIMLCTSDSHVCGCITSDQYYKMSDTFVRINYLRKNMQLTIFCMNDIKLHACIF